MSQLKEKVSSEIILAMKAKDKVRLNALRYLKKLLIENETAKAPIIDIDVAISYAKKLKESLDHFPKDGEHYQNTQAEINVLSEFLPQALGEEEVRTFIAEIVANLENKNMGAVMKELGPRIKGRFDGKRATELVLEALKS